MPGQVRSIASPAREHRGLLWSSSLHFSQLCPLSHHFHDSKSPSSPSQPLFPSSLRSHPGGRPDWAPRPCPEGHVERQPSGTARGGAARERRVAANGARGRGRHDCTRLRTCGCGAVGRGRARPVLLFGGLCPEFGDWDLSARPALLPRVLEVGGGQPGSRLGHSSRCQVAPTDLGIGSRRGCGINTSRERAFLRPDHEPGAGRTSILLAARL